MKNKRIIFKKKIKKKNLVEKQETCANFQQKKLNSRVAEGSQSFQFFRQITWFLGKNRAFSECKY